MAHRAAVWMLALCLVLAGPGGTTVSVADGNGESRIVGFVPNPVADEDHERRGDGRNRED